MPIHLSCALLSAWTRWWCSGRTAWWRGRRGEMGPVAITCFSGGRVTARLSSQQGSAPGPRRSMSASDAVVKEPCGGSARESPKHRAHLPQEPRSLPGVRPEYPPFCLPGAVREPRWARRDPVFLGRPCQRTPQCLQGIRAGPDPNAAPVVKRLSKSVATGVRRVARS